jgi:hypothetical protein
LCDCRQCDASEAELQARHFVQQCAVSRPTVGHARQLDAGADWAVNGASTAFRPMIFPRAARFDEPILTSDRAVRGIPGRTPRPTPQARNLLTTPRVEPDE